MPEKMQVKIGLGDIPVHCNRHILDYFQKDRSAFESVMIIGCDDDGVEQTFNLSTVIKHIVISPAKDENEHYDPQEVKNLLLAKL